MAIFYRPTCDTAQSTASIKIQNITHSPAFISLDEDKDTRSRLEQIRARTPRYLFRLWNNKVDKNVSLSGGYKGLNTTHQITPLAFSSGHGKDAVFDLTREEMAEMVHAHVTGRKSPETEFSSWAASLQWPLGFWNHDADPTDGNDWDEIEDCVYISMIDTMQLWSENQIFHVPSLDFLKPGALDRYPHEYLAHGVIQGPLHRVASLKQFLAPRLAMWGCIDAPDEVEPLTKEDVEDCAEVGRLFGSGYAFAMTLARLCLAKRDEDWFSKGVRQKDIDIVIAGTKGLKIPQEWDTDDTILTDVAIYHAKRYPEFCQVTRLMRALVERWQDESVLGFGNEHHGTVESGRVDEGDGKEEKDGKAQNDGSEQHKCETESTGKDDVGGKEEINGEEDDDEKGYGDEREDGDEKEESDWKDDSRSKEKIDGNKKGDELHENDFGENGDGDGDYRDDEGGKKEHEEDEGTGGGSGNVETSGFEVKAENDEKEASYAEEGR